MTRPPSFGAGQPGRLTPLTGPPAATTASEGPPGAANTPLPTPPPCWLYVAGVGGIQAPPNLWRRFFAWALLGWRWEDPNAARE
jgi:hypothetical protein